MFEYIVYFSWHKRLEASESVIFEIQLYLINLGITTLGDTFTHKLIFLKKILSQHPEIRLIVK